MSSRNGFALLTVLWLLLLLSVLLADVLVPVVVSLRAGENRVLLTRAKWAALGCLELARARFANEAAPTAIDSVALGTTVWCRSESLSPDERVNPNASDSSGLLRVVGDGSRVASVLDWIDADDEPREEGAERDWYSARGRATPRNAPIRDAKELGLIRGFEQVSMGDLERLFTARGEGRLSPNRAPAWALASIAVLSPQDVSKIVTRRGLAARFVTAEQLVSMTGIDVGLEEFRELTRRLSFTESERTTRFQGLVDAGTRRLDYTVVAVLHETPQGLSVAQLEAQ
jgi:type II secretory pathway component PulK